MTTEKSDAHQLGYCGAMFEGIIGHLGAAAVQRAESDDKIIADHIDRALELAKQGLRAAALTSTHTAGLRTGQGPTE